MTSCTLAPSPTRCLRLDLQPLAYLWRRDQESLLSEMISSHLHAILIKVAAFGESLSPLCVLKNVATPSPLLLLSSLVRKKKDERKVCAGAS